MCATEVNPPQGWCLAACGGSSSGIGPGEGGGVAGSTIFTKPIQIFGNSLSQSVTINVIDTASNFSKIGIVVPNPI